MFNSEFITGGLYRINKYVFDDDNSNRDKYLIVLHVDPDNVFIIDTLTTSNNHSIYNITKFGCQGNGQFFFIPKNELITDQSYYFDIDTYIFFKDNIRKEQISKFDKLKSHSKLAIAPLGNLSLGVLRQLLLCMIQSGKIPSGINQIIIDELKKLSINPN